MLVVVAIWHTNTTFEVVHYTSSALMYMLVQLYVPIYTYMCVSLVAPSSVRTREQYTVLQISIWCQMIMSQR